MLRTTPARLLFACFFTSSLVGCGARSVGLSEDDFDVGGTTDSGVTTDSGREDSIGIDSALPDTSVDSFVTPDTAFVDTGVDSFVGVDTGVLDTGRIDTGVIDSGIPDTGIDIGPPDAVGFPAPHSPTPVIGSEGGPVLATPKIIPIVFDGDTFATEIVSYVAAMSGPAGAAYWKAIGSEYGVAQPTASALIKVHETPPTAITNDEIRTWLTGKLSGSSPEFGPPDSNAIYTIFYPDTTSITLAPGFDSCSAFGGYHDEDDLPSGGKVAYAVMPRCTGLVPGGTEFDNLTAAASHEWIEASTDPFFETARGYDAPDDKHLAWAIFPGTEVGDMCAAESDAFYKESFGFEVQRIWSNVAANAGHNPCVPAPSDPYFNSAPVLVDGVTIDLGTGAGPQPTNGVKIPVGSSKTIEVDLFSDAPTSGPWTVQALDIGALTGGSPTLNFSFDRTGGQNGDVLHLTITVTAAGPGGGSEFALRSSLAGNRHYWYGWVGN